MWGGVAVIADVFQALVQDRPYRSGLTADAALAVVDEMSGKGLLDAGIVQLLKDNLKQCADVARGEH